MPNRSPARGFTLIEVLVALAIVSIGMIAVFKVIGDTANNVAYLRDRSIAAWIADNRLTELRLSGELPSVDETEGELEYAKQRWHWVQKVATTPVAGLRRVDVSVRREADAEGTSLVSMAGFIGQAAAATGPSSRPWNPIVGGGGEP